MNMCTLNRSAITLLSGLIGILLILTGCGGGGGNGENTGANEGISSGGGAYSISIDKTNVTFSATTDGESSGSVLVKAQFKGDGVIVGYPPNVTEASWLSLSTLSSTANTVTFELRFFPGNIASNYNTTLRFTTGKVDGTNLKYVDLPVSLSVKEGFSVGAAETQFNFQSTGRIVSTINTSDSFNCIKR